MGARTFEIADVPTFANTFGIEPAAAARVRTAFAAIAAGPIASLREAAAGTPEAALQPAARPRSDIAVGVGGIAYTAYSASGGKGRGHPGFADALQAGRATAAHNGRLGQENAPLPAPPSYLRRGGRGGQELVVHHRHDKKAPGVVYRPLSTE